MKFILMAFIWIVIIGSVVLYLGTREQATGHTGTENHFSKVSYDIEILASFELEPNPFSEGNGIAAGVKNTPSLRILLNGIEVVRETSRHKEMKPLHFKNAAVLETGKNEFYIEAFSIQNNFGRDLSIRLRIMNGQLIKYERTFWSDGENSIRGTFIVEVPKKEE
jgi:hypothetical protein